MRSFCSRLFAAGLLLAGGPALAASQAAAPVRLELNIPTQRLVVYEGEQVTARYPVSVGVPGHDTPNGSFTVTHAEWNPWWRPPEREWARGKKVTPPGKDNPMGRVKLFFEPLYFIHGTPDTANLGSPASHGCVRMHNDDVVQLARLLHERAAPSLRPEAIDAVLRDAKTTRRSNFGRPVSFVIRYDRAVVEDGQLRIYPDLYKRGGLHTEAVYQALLAAGHDVRNLPRARVQQVVEKARGAPGRFAIPVAELLDG